MDANKCARAPTAGKLPKHVLGDRMRHVSHKSHREGREELRSSLLTASSSSLSLSMSEDLTVSSMDRASKMVVALDSPNPEDLLVVFSNANVGGKALHLAEMISHAKLAGATELIRVPRASVVTTAGYDAHVAALGGDLEQLLASTLATGDLAALPRIRDMIQGKSSNDKLLKAGIKLFLASCPETTNRFAVRSSSTAEDQGAASFAGQYETCLNVPRDGILKAVKRCWASMWTERILSYRKSAGFHSDAKLSMAVVIQQQVNSEAAGVAFSMNPVNGHQNESVVEAVWGQGEGLVGGSLTPHSYQVDWHRSTILATSKRSVKQEQKFALLEQANEHGDFVARLPTTERERSSAPLSDEQVLSISNMALQVAAVYGVPYDIEWAREGDVIYLLQARPITSFSLQTQGLWDYAGFDESCVLTLSMSAHGYAAMMSQALQVAQGDLSRIFFCKAYINSDMWRNFSKANRQKRKGKSSKDLVPPVRARIESSLAHFEAAAHLRKAYSVESLQTLLTLQDELNTSSFIVGEAAEFAEKVLDSYIRWMNQDCGTSLSLAPLVDGINYASEATYSSTVLGGLGFLCAACPPLFDLVRSGGTVAEARALQDANAKGFVEQFDAFLARFFFMSNRDEDLSGLRWVDDPSVPWAIFGAMVRSQEPAPPAGFKMRLKNVQTMIASPTTPVMSRETEIFTQGRDELRAAVRKHLLEGTDAHLKIVDDSVSALRELLHLKEQIHVVYTQNNYYLRQQIVQLCLGSGLAEKSGPHWNGVTLLRTHPIFSLDYTSLGEIWAFPLGQQKKILHNAHLESQMFRLFKNPPVVGAKVEKHVVESQSAPQLNMQDGKILSGSLLQGVGCSAGVVTGTARIIASLDDSALMQRGDILLTRYTDPSWTMLMSLARGIILVDGGILAHAAVVARELKIPCVVQVRETMSIVSGSTITIDGTKGYVKVVELAPK